MKSWCSPVERLDTLLDLNSLTSISPQSHSMSSCDVGNNVLLDLKNPNSQSDVNLVANKDVNSNRVASFAAFESQPQNLSSLSLNQEQQFTGNIQLY